MNCPKCGSSNVSQITFSFPAIYRCDDCDFVFTKNENP